MHLARAMEFQRSCYQRYVVLLKLEMPEQSHLENLLNSLGPLDNGFISGITFRRNKRKMIEQIIEIGNAFNHINDRIKYLIHIIEIQTRLLKI